MLTPASFMSRIVSRGRFYATRVCSFDEAKAAVNTLKQDPDNEVKLRMYGLFKQVGCSSVKFRLFQATSGDCSGDKPGAFNFVAKAKWQAWDSLKSMSKVTRRLPVLGCLRFYETIASIVPP
ncbi:Acyl-CoA-binding protein [Paragonimus heterotremus]|uniref:Acyl-CoA-binding protein n=1 Tax=Paragonimus heterotremus TaxID=100268 RepID=A0A8J4SJZ1_9TREM|nr:Acyl-CoA-binding protein [Paragonimus heterotremus]